MWITNANDSILVARPIPVRGAYLANDLGEGSSLVLGDDHRRNQQGPFGPVWKLLAQAQEVLKHRGGATLLNCEVLSAASPLHFTSPAPLYLELPTGILSTIHLNLTDAQSTAYLLGNESAVRG